MIDEHNPNPNPQKKGIITAHVDIQIKAIIPVCNEALQNAKAKGKMSYTRLNTKWEQGRTRCGHCALKRFGEK